MRSFAHALLAFSLLTGCSVPPERREAPPPEGRTCDACEATVLDPDSEFCPDCLRRLGDEDTSKSKSVALPEEKRKRYKKY